MLVFNLKRVWYYSSYETLIITWQRQLMVVIETTINITLLINLTIYKGSTIIGYYMANRGMHLILLFIFYNVGLLNMRLTFNQNILVYLHKEKH